MNTQIQLNGVAVAYSNFECVDHYFSEKGLRFLFLMKIHLKIIILIKALDIRNEKIIKLLLGI